MFYSLCSNRSTANYAIQSSKQIPLVNKEKVTRYFEESETRPIRDDLVFAADITPEPKIAIDCGCGAGADINYLLEKGFTVHAFDIEEESIDRCKSRFNGIDEVILTKASFLDFTYPEASLVVADASLFFCPGSEFKAVWSKIYDCLCPNGLFCGSLLGNEDSMAAPGDNPAVFWPEVSSFEESEVMQLLKGYEILRFKTHRSTGKSPQGFDHNWHLFQIVARKPG
jgi:SAM-dependent methyltransferase